MDQQDKRPGSQRFLRLAEVIARVGLSKSSIYAMMDPKSDYYDPTFPARIKMTANGKAVRWLELDIDNWIASRAGAFIPDDDNRRSLLAPPLAAPPAPAPVPSSKDIKRIEEEGFERKRPPVIRQMLEERAKQGALVLYRELMQATMLTPDNPTDLALLDKLLGEIATSSHAENKVLLGAHVHEKKGSQSQPRPAFFALAESLGYDVKGDPDFVHTQIVELFSVYKDPAYRTKTRNELYWIEVPRTGKTFLAWRGKE